MVRTATLIFALLWPGLVYQDQSPTLFLIGDSTMSDKPLEDNPERGWGQLLPEFFPSGFRIENHARNGRSTRSFIEEHRWDTVMARLHRGDFVIMQFGHNDGSIQKTDRYTPPDQYRTNLGRFIDDTRRAGASPILCTPIVRRRFGSDSLFYDTHGIYPDIVRQLADSLGVPMIDMHRESRKIVVGHGPEGSKAIYLWVRPGTYSSLPEGKTDNTHFSEYGARIMAGIAVRFLQHTKHPLAAYLK